MAPSCMALSGKNCRTLCRIYEEPIRKDIHWSDFVRLCRALGAEFPKPGRTSGFRTRIKLKGRKAVFHRPHPQPEMKEGSVRSARDFLGNAGVTPDSEGC